MRVVLAGFPGREMVGSVVVGIGKGFLLMAKEILEGFAFECEVHGPHCTVDMDELSTKFVQGGKVVHLAKRSAE